MHALIAGLRRGALATVAAWLGLAAPLSQAQTTNPNYTALWWARPHADDPYD